MITINNESLSYMDVWRVACKSEAVKLSKSALKSIEAARNVIDSTVANGEIIYGVTTGFGAFKNTTITSNDVRRLQENLIVSHAVGVGNPLPQEVVRGMMAIMVNYLAKGHSGVRPVVVETLVEMLNKKVHPIIPEQGSVGSSGDLAPSSHLILVLIGKGEAKYKGQVTSGKEAMALAGITPIELEAKEGLALINNTSCMTSIAAINLYNAHNLIDHADTTGALSAEALRATDKAFLEQIHDLKPHDGQITTAKNVRQLLDGSSMIDKTRIQDQYSIRCIPQVHGAVREALSYITKVVNTEINSVTDNPLIVMNEDGKPEVISGGNFHGEPVAIAMDTLGIAMSELANIADRRIASLLDTANNHGLPAFLCQHGGLNSGLMILQYTTAALASENKVLAHPSSVDSIPTSANVEDIVSMGTIGSRKAHAIIQNVTNVLAIEYLVACQAIDFRLMDDLKLGKGTEERYKTIRKFVPFFSQDQVYYPYVKKIVRYIQTGEVPNN